MPHDTTRQTAGVAAMALLIFLLALAPRALATGEFVTVDEGVHWFTRARTFLAGIQSGDYAQTIVAGHPGVTTAWLGAIGELIYQQVGADDPALRQRLLRLPVAVVTALCVALAFLLLRRLLGGRVALLAALLLASDPFLIAHSQLLHLDALLTSFMLVSLLAAMLAFRLDRPALGGPPRW
ncbi:MAG: glycosyltransferase family 39 protein, partial [Chloroflexota bacterium]